MAGLRPGNLLPTMARRFGKEASQVSVNPGCMYHSFVNIRPEMVLDTSDVNAYFMLAYIGRWKLTKNVYFNGAGAE